jgi:protocatechuate 3,4-dioxygenase beta subunit
MVPAAMHGTSPGDAIWFVEEKGLEQDGSYADLRVVKMTNVLSATPTFTDYYVPLGAYTITPFPEDTMGQVSFVLDTRVLNIDWRNNEMAVAQDVGIGIDTNVHARWYEISTAGASPTLVQQGEVNPGPGIDTYMPSVAITADGTIGMTYIESAAPAGTFLGENMSMYVTGRAASDPLGTMQTPVLAKAGEQNYQGTRIGDFSGITVDPNIGGTFWAANEYSISTTSIILPNWGTWIASFTVTPLGVTPGSISGLVFNDLNGDGLNESEPGFNGVTIELFDSGNNLVGSTVTATGSDGRDGEYSFTNLTPGNYTVMEIVPTGWTATTATSAPAVVTSGTDTGAVNFGDFQLGTLSGTQFEDITGNGFSADDTPLSSTKQVVTINLFLNGGTTPLATTTTDSNGNYTFSNLGPGNYTVQEIVPSGWMLTAQTAATTVATSGFASPGNNFDDFQLVTLSGTIFNDLNGDGTQESGEPGLQNWVADLLKGTALVKQILTDASGNFSFTNIAPGTYTVQEEQEPGWLLTSTPAAYTVTTNSGVNVGGNVFGNFQTMRISGTVFDDLNGDGVQEAGEPGLQGWTLDLVRGQSTAKRTTDSNGNFTFVSVGPGTFTLQEEVKAGWMQTTMPLTYSVTTTSGTDVSGFVFGNITPATHFTISEPT